MGKSLTQKLSIALLALFAMATGVQAADEKPAKPGKDEKKEARQARYPFNGKLDSVDKTAMTVTVAGKENKRILHITSETRIMKAGKPATLDDAVVGEAIGGQALKTPDGKEQAVSLRLGAKPDAPEKKEKPAKKDKKQQDN
ncbi:MAG: hypothetical protein AB1813_15290 [Verrucomicrobiota bacterium]